MGWTFTVRSKKTLAQHREDHVRDATDYGDRKIARIIAHEWHPRTWYALIGFYETPESQKPYRVFLRTDIIDMSGGEFGYKDMSEDMGPYLDDKPSKKFAAAVYRYKPHAEGYAVEFRERMGIKYDSQQQLVIAETDFQPEDEA